MSRPQFSLSSDQLELLLMFEESEGLGKLAEQMGRDPSVISRSLQRIAEEFHVLVKVKGRWEITPLGRQTNELTRKFIADQHQLLPIRKNINLEKISFSNKSVLIVINAQQGLIDSTQEGRNNSNAEKNIGRLLEFWRKTKKKVFHIQHISESPSSIFFKNSSGCQFLPTCTPQKGEAIIEKNKSSAFFETQLEVQLKNIEPENIILVGFTANECIDATAKDAAALGFTSLVVGDATAMFDMRGPDGKLIKAERLHKLTLANINAYYAKVIQTSDITAS
ncbi:MAG: isochorismatase family protein [Bdellovibrionaceae bacterium]|nr:isochorismatase family protein [Pseudobdellovibrionaceae bacterium]